MSSQVRELKMRPEFYNSMYASGSLGANLDEAAGTSDAVLATFRTNNVTGECEIAQFENYNAALNVTVGHCDSDGILSQQGLQVIAESASQNFTISTEHLDENAGRMTEFAEHVEMLPQWANTAQEDTREGPTLLGRDLEGTEVIYGL
jgi:hypothetical protein